MLYEGEPNQSVSILKTPCGFTSACTLVLPHSRQPLGPHEFLVCMPCPTRVTMTVVLMLLLSALLDRRLAS